MKKLVFLALAFLFVSCGQQVPVNSEVKIVGGEEVSDSRNDAIRKSTVALTTKHKSIMQQKHSFCSGTILSKRVIMTAAHCIQKFDQQSQRKLDEYILPSVSDFLVSFDTEIDENGTYIVAERVVPHPDWDPAQTVSSAPTSAPNDIGLVFLSEDIPSTAMPAKLADTSDISATTVHLAGYGVTLSRNQNDTGKLRHVETTLKKFENNIKRFQVGAIMKGACAGDSGGPAYVKKNGRFEVIGATSTGIELFGYCVGILNNYTDARYYKDWIEGEMAR